MWEESCMLFTLLDETLQIQSSKVLLVGREKSAQKNDKIEESHKLRRSFCVMNLIYKEIYYNIENYKVNLKYCAFHSLKGGEIY